ncbi:hypothetical protein GCK72_026196 [Caenorhabditis remanei]|nr:hypothetical protein GCK72_026196 [Caenorhabditis remanei]KAF1749728.1 hypothetical protein GCK72_026196 [Caenorhabditis remanei]
MDWYDSALFGVDWIEYEAMYPPAMKSKCINRTLEINMIQSLLKHGFANEDPVVLSEFWRCFAEEANLNGSWTLYKNQYLQQDNNCICHFDGNSRIISIHSDDNEIVKSGTHRKVAKKDAPKCDKVLDVKDTKDNVKTIEMFYDKVRHLLDSHFKRKRLDYQLYIGLKEDTKQKEVSNHGLLVIIKKLAQNVVESEEEEGNGPKMEKYEFLLILNTMAIVIPGDKYTKNRIDRMFNLEAERNECISLAMLGQLNVKVMGE